MLPKLIDDVTDEEFKSGLESHLEDTRQPGHKRGVRFANFEEEPHAEEFIGFEGLKRSTTS